MISDRGLELAIERGIVTADQAERLRLLERDIGIPEAADDEKLRLITGFADIFVTIGIALFIGALAYFVTVSAGPIAAGVGVALVSWGLSEFFTRRRRMALPSIVLLLIFAAAVFVALFVGGIELTSGVIPDMRHVSIWKTGPARAALFVLPFVALATAVAVALHYWRFRVPITIAVGVATLVAMVFGLALLVAPDFTLGRVNPLLLACGVAVFALAMRYDLSDPRRLTRRTDIAFWLHLLAAPLIVHTLIGGYIVTGSAFDGATAVRILAVFLALAFIAVLVDRRAVLVSGLTYAGFACGTLLRQSSFADKTVPATLLLLGAFVLLLSAGWHPLRHQVLAVLPASLTRRLSNKGTVSLS